MRLPMTSEENLRMNSDMKLVAAEAASTLTWSSSLETRSAALNLALTLIEGIKDEDDYNRASNALSFAKHGGVDACAHMVTATASLGASPSR